MVNERLISAPKLVIKLAERYNKGASGNGLICYDAVMATIADAPTADAVEVVRCKDCKYYIKLSESDKHCRCSIFCGCYDRPYPTEPDDFCSYGERREVGCE